MGLNTKQQEILNKLCDYINDTWIGQIKNEENL